MENTPDSPRTLVVISIWAEALPGKQLAWRGSIRTLDGKRMEFCSLADLNRMLADLSGWHDSPAGLVEGRCSE
jgi:hypothetical protein